MIQNIQAFREPFWMCIRFYHDYVEISFYQESWYIQYSTIDPEGLE